MEAAELSEDVSLRTQFTVDDLDIEILPLIYEIIRRYVFPTMSPSSHARASYLRLR